MAKSVRDVFQELADAHFEIEQGLRRVGLFSPPGDDEVKIIEVNDETFPSGTVVPFLFSPSGGLTRHVRIADVTEEEWKEILEGKIPLPEGWSRQPIEVKERSE